MVAHWWQCTNDQNGLYLSGKLANGDFFVVLRVYNECTQGDGLIAGATSSLAGLQLTLSAVQLRVEPDIQLLALREIGFTPLHKTGAVDGSATFTLLI